MLNFMPLLRELNIWSMMLRVLMAMAAGGLIGIERERKRRPAGFRTYMLVALGGSLTIMLSQYFNLMLNTAWADVAAEVGIRTDVSRLGAQVINGVGFLGAGTIIVTGRHEVKGLTTASGLWGSACMGLAVGAGFYECVLVFCVLMFLIMKLLPSMERFFLAESPNMNVYIGIDSVENVGKIMGMLRGEGIRVYDVEMNPDSKDNHISVLVSMKLPRRTPHTEILTMLSRIDGMVSIKEV